MGNGVGGIGGTTRYGSPCGFLFPQPSVLVCHLQSYSCTIDNVIAIWGVGDSDVMAILVHSIMVGEGCGIDCMGDECHS